MKACADFDAPPSSRDLRIRHWERANPWGHGSAGFRGEGRRRDLRA
eukprot:CAMPEP_0117619312 /NCGR_PEP_ID=MMETSP0784-20121206/86553_1 /TAXON_ID=39447 /ORGANISM="" /LENGTH=45 /DNA_ID= /DNA_START= /DNA_END= /DNA_ORIENTATION=